MADVLAKFCKEIKDVRVYLIKIGHARRKGNILVKKLSEANEIFSRYLSCVNEISSNVSKGLIKPSDTALIDEYIKTFQTLYTEVAELCRFSEPDENKMSTFNIKVALSLLPLMSDEESNTERLIENIEYYASTLSSAECKNKLIEFVLKSRLSQAAKLQLKSSYSSVTDLIHDMKNTLLPKKSASAIQTKLTRMRQNDLTIKDYGNQISELFINLTISQADGNPTNYNLLKPINEQFAIKKFSDGLRNRRLSTIIAARNFSSLKDAIQAAQDEESESATTSGDVLGMSSIRGFNNRFSRGRGRHFSQGYSYGRFNRRACTWRRGSDYNMPRGGRNHYRGSSNRRGQQNAFAPTRPMRGKSYYNSNQGTRQVNLADESQFTSKQDSENTFFRD